MTAVFSILFRAQERITCSPDSRVEDRGMTLARGWVLVSSNATLHSQTSLRKTQGFQYPGWRSVTVPPDAAAVRIPRSNIAVAACARLASELQRHDAFCRGCASPVSQFGMVVSGMWRWPSGHVYLRQPVSFASVRDCACRARLARVRDEKEQSSFPKCCADQLCFTAIHGGAPLVDAMYTLPIYLVAVGPVIDVICIGCHLADLSPNMIAVVLGVRLLAEILRERTTRLLDYSIGRSNSGCPGSALRSPYDTTSRVCAHTSRLFTSPCSVWRCPRP